MSEEPYRPCSSRTDVVSSDPGRGCPGDEEAQRGAAGAAGLPCPPAPPGQRQPKRVLRPLLRQDGASGREGKSQGEIKCLVVINDVEGDISCDLRKMLRLHSPHSCECWTSVAIANPISTPCCFGGVWIQANIHSVNSHLACSLLQDFVVICWKFQI